MAIVPSKIPLMSVDNPKSAKLLPTIFKARSTVFKNPLACPASIPLSRLAWCPGTGVLVEVAPAATAFDNEADTSVLFTADSLAEVLASATAESAVEASEVSTLAEFVDCDVSLVDS